ncbi:MAG: hypothetical protein STSR0008_18330 [Ignavibacterium sp.]
MVVLPNGDVLVSGSGADSIQSSSEIYEFATGKWRYTSPMNIQRALHNLVLLNTGKVLAIGGYKEQSCELFDPQTETWMMTDSIPTFRFTGQTVTELADDRIMVTGGYYIDTTTWNLIILNKVDIYNPITESWVQATPMQLERTEHTATLLNDGKVLVTGGETYNFTTDQCEIYNPNTNTWEFTGSMMEERSDHAALLLNHDRVFICGGDGMAPWQKSCEVYNMGIWSYTSDMLAYRANPNSYFLENVDKILILGGDALPFSTEDTWEIYDPVLLQPVFLESFPINQFLLDNNVQLLNGNIFLAGSEEYDFNPMPYAWPTKRCWIFDVATDVNKDKEMLKSYKLNQNFPNPFNPATAISFFLAKAGTVTLKVYDLLGREVATLLDEQKSAGSHTVQFTADRLASGIYIYRIQSGSYRATKKMILIK